MCVEVAKRGSTPQYAISKGINNSYFLIENTLSTALVAVSSGYIVRLKFNNSARENRSEDKAKRQLGGVRY